MERIGIYVGSFDPFHIGHLEVAKVALNYVSKVIIVPNNPNKSKIYRNDVKHRFEMIRLSIKDEPHIIVTDEDVNIINTRLYDTYYVIGLIGADQCRTQPKTKVHEWLIVPRVGYKIPLLNWLNTSPVPNTESSNLHRPLSITYLPASLFCNQEWSSTEIRRELMAGRIPRQLCNEDVITYIRENLLYTLETQAKHIINKNRSIMPEIKSSDDITMNKVKSNVIIINNSIVMKSFPDIQSYLFESEAFQIANKLGLPIPEYLFRDNFIIVMKYTGKSIKEKVKEGYDPYVAGLKVGILLRRCHDTTRVRVEKSKILENRKIKNMMESGLLNDCSNLFDEYICNPGMFGYCHGDASVNNFTIMDDKIFMIDFSGLSKMNSTGIPGYEYYQFLTSIQSNFYDFNDVDLLSKGFINGYGDKQFTSESEKLFMTYWNRMLTTSH